jgi:hypothetical protein
MKNSFTQKDLLNMVGSNDPAIVKAVEAVKKARTNLLLNCQYLSDSEKNEALRRFHTKVVIV